MKVKEYLNNQVEPMPKWLEDYVPGTKINIDDLRDSRLVYYPGSGTDGQAIRTFNEARYAHIFIYVDYMVRSEFLIKDLNKDNAVRGYHVIGQHFIDKSELTKEDWKMHIDDFKPDYSFVDKNIKPYCLITIFERDDDYTDEHGSKRFVLINLFADGIASYDALFANKNFKISVALIQDHGFGGNYDRFGKGGLMERIAKQTNIYPEYICVCKGNEWKGYELVEGLEAEIGGMWLNHRYLYKKV